MNDQSHTLHLSSKKSPPPLLLRLAVCPARPMPRLHGWTPPSPPPRTRKRWAEPSIQIAHPHPPPQSLAPHHPIAFSPLFPLDVDGAERQPRAPAVPPSLSSLRREMGRGYRRFAAHDWAASGCRAPPAPPNVPDPLRFRPSGDHIPPRLHPSSTRPLPAPTLLNSPYRRTITEDPSWPDINFLTCFLYQLVMGMGSNFSL